MERVVRAVLLLAGLALAGYGATLLLDLGWDNLRASVLWLAGGVVLHDGVLAPLTIIAAVLALRVFRGRMPAPVVVGAIVLGSVTLVAVPELGRFGARPDNPTLLDRHYLLGWLLFAAVVVAVTVVATVLAKRRQHMKYMP